MPGKALAPDNHDVGDGIGSGFGERSAPGGSDLLAFRSPVLIRRREARRGPNIRNQEPDYVNFGMRNGKPIGGRDRLASHRSDRENAVSAAC